MARAGAVVSIAKPIDPLAVLSRVSLIATARACEPSAKGEGGSKVAPIAVTVKLSVTT